LFLFQNHFFFFFELPFYIFFFLLFAYVAPFFVPKFVIYFPNVVIAAFVNDVWRIDLVNTVSLILLCEQLNFVQSLFTSIAPHVILQFLDSKLKFVFEIALEVDL
jgi:hypothetical protein